MFSMYVILLYIYIESESENIISDILIGVWKF